MAGRPPALYLVVLLRTIGAAVHARPRCRSASRLSVRSITSGLDENGHKLACASSCSSSSCSSGESARFFSTPAAAHASTLGRNGKCLGGYL